MTSGLTFYFRFYFLLPVLLFTSGFTSCFTFYFRFYFRFNFFTSGLTFYFRFYFLFTSLLHLLLPFLFYFLIPVLRFYFRFYFLLPVLLPVLCCCCFLKFFSKCQSPVDELWWPSVDINSKLIIYGYIFFLFFLPFLYTLKHKHFCRCLQKCQRHMVTVLLWLIMDTFNKMWANDQLSYKLQEVFTVNPRYIAVHLSRLRCFADFFSAVFFFFYSALCSASWLAKGL